MEDHIHGGPRPVPLVASSRPGSDVSPTIFLLRACSIIGSVCLVICETLQTGRSLFAGLPELHDKMNGFFFQFQLQKENTTSYNMNHMV